MYKIIYLIIFFIILFYILDRIKEIIYNFNNIYINNFNNIYINNFNTIILNYNIYIDNSTFILKHYNLINNIILCRFIKKYEINSNNNINIRYNKNLKFKLFISSNIDYEKYHLNRLIKNINEINIPNNCVHIIIGGYPEEKIEYINEIEIIKVPYRSFEFTSFSYIIKNPDKYDFDYAFFSHDTVIFGNNFYNNIKENINYMNNYNYETMGIDDYYSMNIGLYTKNIILKNKSIINDITIYNNDKKNLFKLKERLILIEDVILYSGKKYNKKNILKEIKYKGKDSNNKIVNLWRKHYINIDIIKIQTNNGINGKVKSIYSPI